jgi:hypothetical protein
MVVPDVQQVHDQLRDAAAVGPLLLGRSWAASVVGLAGLPIRAAEYVDEAGAARLAVVERTDGAGVIAAVPLRNADALLAVSTAGERAPFRVHRDAAGPFDLLVRTDGRSDAPALAVAGNYLLIADRAASITEAGRFLSQPGAPPELDAASCRQSGAHARGVVRWSSLRRGLTASLERLPGIAALVDVPSSTASFEPPAETDVSVRLVDGAIVADVDLGPSSVLAPLELEPGPIGRLLEMPADAQAGAVLFQSAAGRKQAAQRGAASLGRLFGADARRLAGALDDLAAARGAEVLVGLERGVEGPMFYGSASIRDRDEAASALGRVTKSIAEESFRSSLAARGIDVSASETVLERIGDVTRIRVRPKSGAAPGVGFDAALRLESDRLVFASGEEAAGALRKVLAGGASARLAGVGPVREVARRVGEEVLAALFVDPKRLVASRPPTDAQESRSVVVAALGARGGRGHLVAAADAAAAATLVHPGLEGGR